MFHGDHSDGANHTLILRTASSTSKAGDGGRPCAPGLGDETQDRGVLGRDSAALDMQRKLLPGIFLLVLIWESKFGLSLVNLAPSRVGSVGEDLSWT